MRFIATADWQLGMPANYLDEQARPRYHQARLDAVRRIGELAAERRAQFVLVCGDVFDSNQLDRAIVARTFEVLRRFTVPVVLLPGNHDTLDAMSIYSSPAFTDRVPDGVHVLRDCTPVEVVPGVEVVGAPWFSKRPQSDLVADACSSLQQPADGVVRIIAGHGAVSGLDPDRDSQSTISLDGMEASLASSMAHMFLLGDRHGTHQVWEKIWYPGTPEVTARREVDPGNVLLVDLDTDDVCVEKIRVGRWHFTTVTWHFTGAQDVEALARHLDQMPDKDRTAVWLSLTGTVSTATKARLDQVLEEAGQLFARLDMWQRHMDLAVIPEDEDFADLGLGGFAEDAVKELSVMAKLGTDDAHVAQDALGLLYRLVGGSR